MPRVENEMRILRAIIEKCQGTYTGIPIRITVDLQEEMLQVRRTWAHTFQALKQSNCHLRALYFAKLS
jgi:hypothetical protein